MRKLFAAVAFAASMIASAPANAVVYTIDFTFGGLGSGDATLTTAGDASAGYSLVTALTGTFNGNALTLLAPGTFPQPVSVANDNLFTTTSPFFDFNGLSVSGGGSLYNLYSSGSANFVCIGTTTTNCSTISATVSLRQQGAVPEPATWAMMIVGFGAVGLGVRRARARKAVRAVA